MGQSKRSFAADAGDYVFEKGTHKLILKMLVYSVLLIGVSSISFSSTYLLNLKSKEEMKEHMVLALTLSRYYCQYNKWPSSLREIKKYNEKINISMNTKVKWRNFDSGLYRLEFSDEIKVVSKIFNEDEPIGELISINKPPVCELEKIKTNFSPHLKHYEDKI